MEGQGARIESAEAERCHDATFRIEHEDVGTISKRFVNEPDHIGAAPQIESKRATAEKERAFDACSFDPIPELFRNAQSGSTARALGQTPEPWMHRIDRENEHGTHGASGQTEHQ